MSRGISASYTLTDHDEQVIADIVSAIGRGLGLPYEQIRLRFANDDVKRANSLLRSALIQREVVAGLRAQQTDPTEQEG